MYCEHKVRKEIAGVLRREASASRKVRELAAIRGRLKRFLATLGVGIGVLHADCCFAAVSRLKRSMRQIENSIRMVELTAKRLAERQPALTFGYEPCYGAYPANWYKEASA